MKQKVSPNQLHQPARRKAGSHMSEDSDRSGDFQHLAIEIETSLSSVAPTLWLPAQRSAWTWWRFPRGAGIAGPAIDAALQLVAHPLGLIDCQRDAATTLSLSQWWPRLKNAYDCACQRPSNGRENLSMHIGIPIGLGVIIFRPAHYICRKGGSLSLYPPPRNLDMRNFAQNTLAMVFALVLSSASFNALIV